MRLAYYNGDAIAGWRSEFNQENKLTSETRSDTTIHNAVDGRVEDDADFGDSEGIIDDFPDERGNTLSLAMIGHPEALGDTLPGEEEKEGEGYTEKHGRHLVVALSDEALRA